MNSLAFVLILIGVLLIYGEFIWIGKIVFGFLGSIQVLIGLSILCRAPHDGWALVGIIAASVCFCIEGLVNTSWIWGLVGGFILGWGSWKLCLTEPIKPWISFPSSLLMAAVTILLLDVAKRARQNKRVS